MLAQMWQVNPPNQIAKAVSIQLEFWLSQRGLKASNVSDSQFVELAAAKQMGAKSLSEVFGKVKSPLVDSGRLYAPLRHLCLAPCRSSATRRPALLARSLG